MKKKLGLATMTKARRSEIAKMGGIAGHKQGVAHQWTSREAAAAGRKGGRKSGEVRARLARARIAEEMR
jgi:general stress protein YciG